MNFKDLFASMRPEFYMFKICAYCRKPLGLVECSPEQHEKKTHGVCTSCSTKTPAELNQMAIAYKRGNNVLS